MRKRQTVWVGPGALRLRLAQRKENNMSTEDELIAEIAQASSRDLVAQIRETLELAVDAFNHRADFAALDELERRLEEAGK
jgi:hypothetical protein